MDKADKAILRELMQVNCRSSYRGMANKFNLSPNVVKYRVKKLIKEGVIVRFNIIQAHETAGYDDIFGIVFTDGTEKKKDLVSQIGRIPMICSVSPLVTAEGGAYFLWGQCIGPTMQTNLGAQLRGINNVRKVELHRAPRLITGSKVDSFSRPQLRVLRCLQQDPRMKAVEIARKTGMASKSVRRILGELETSRGIYYSCRVDLSAGGLVGAMVRFEWDDKMIAIDDIVHWLQDDYPDELWYIHISTSESVMFVDLLLDSLKELEIISSRIRNALFVKSTVSLAYTTSSTFDGLGEIKLRELLDEAGV